MRPAVSIVKLTALVAGLTAGCIRSRPTEDATDTRRSAIVSCIQNPTAVSGGAYHTCSLLPGGTVECWGRNFDGELGNGTTESSATARPVTGLSGVVALSVGGSSNHTCAVRGDGTVACWGYNLDGELGNGTTTNSSVPVTVSGLSDAVAVAVGTYHTCALRAGGTVACWGYNGYGELGNGTTTGSSTPVAVSGLSGAVAIAAGFEASCAVLSGGSVRCWGYNGAGTLGDGSGTSSSTPVSVTGLAGATAIAMDDHVCAVIAGGQVACWGLNHRGQIGDGSTATAFSPRVVPGLTGMTDVAAGIYFTCARSAAGGVACWGDNRFRQAASGPTVSAPPTTVPGLTGITSITAGGFHACARRPDGLQCWGGDWGNQLGDGAMAGGLIPAVVPALSDVAEVSAGSTHTCARLDDGTARCWGDNASGQLGGGATSVRSLTPIPVAGLNGLTGLAAGGGHNCGLRFDGNVFCWGENMRSQLGVDGVSFAAAPVLVAGLSEAVQVAAGYTHTCARLTEGAVACWGDNSNGQLGIGTTVTTSVPTAIPELANSGVVEIATGGHHSCARLTDGTVQCWGYNGEGGLGNGTTTNALSPVPVPGLSNVTQISLGDSHSCALRADGTVACWGGAIFNEIFGGRPPIGPLVPTTVAGLSNVVRISAGGYHTCALIVGGTAVCWGYNAEGQVGNGTTGRSSPLAVVTVAALSGITNLSAGFYHSCARRIDGVVACWGGDAFGALGTGVPPDSFPPRDVVCSLGNTPAPAGAVCTSGNQCASGFCTDGVCCATACGGNDPNDCQACAVVTGASADGTCTALPSTRVCRPSTGLCDVAESCTGSSPACPADASAAGCAIAPVDACGADTCGAVTVGPATLTFNGGVSAGDVAVTPCTATSQPPTGFQIVVGSTGQRCWNIDTTASYATPPPISVCFAYPQSGAECPCPAAPIPTCTSATECRYRLAHDDGAGYTMVMNFTLDTVNNRICGAVNSLSPFIVVVPTDLAPPAFAGVPDTRIAYAAGTAGAAVDYAPPTAADAVDGPVPVTCAPASGSTFAPGKTIVTCTASDAAGNTATATFTVWVQYQAPADGTFFGKPIRPDGSSRFKIGRAVPVKFQLTGASAGITDLVAKLTVARISGAVRGTTDCEGDEEGEDTDMVFRYRKAKGIYAYRWKTRGETPGTYRLSVDLGDGATHQVDVSLRTAR